MIERLTKEKGLPAEENTTRLTSALRKEESSFVFIKSLFEIVGESCKAFKKANKLTILCSSKKISLLVFSSAKKHFFQVSPWSILLQVTLFCNDDIMSNGLINVNML